MTDKNINIPVKVKNAEQAKQQLNSVAAAGKNVGNGVAAGSKHSAAEQEKANKKLTQTGGILGGLKGQVMGFIGGWFGLQAVTKGLSMFIQKLETIKRLQTEIYEKSLSFTQVGQALEFQTGTVGKQQFWSKEALALEEAGGLKAGVAGQMLTSMDIAFSQLGGIKNKQVRQLGSQLAPFAGTAQMGPEQIAKLFEFAGTAGVDPDPEAYMQYFAKLQAGFTSSKATDFGQFMLGLQKGGTAYMAQGGSLGEAISTFSGARAVLPNEALAATALEQIARISSGGYEKPRQAIERSLGVRWQDMSMDERTAAVLKHVGDIPEAKRGQVLAQQGFPQEMMTQIGKMVTPEALETMASTRGRVASATDVTVNNQIRAYLNSMLGKSRINQARRSIDKLQGGTQFAGWSERLKTAKGEHDILVASGRDSRMIPDDSEPMIMALQSLLAEMDQLSADMPADKRGGIDDLRSSLKTTIGIGKFSPGVTTGLGLLNKAGQQFSEGLKAETSIHYHNETIFNPRFGDDKRGERFTQD